MTYCNTLIPRGKQETLVRRCSKPNTDGLAKESHFRAADARYASASLVEMPLYCGGRARWVNIDNEI